MITTSTEWKEYSALHNVYHIKAVLTSTDGTVLNLTDEDFMMGSVHLSDACSSSNSFDIGAVITNTFECTFNNTSGKFDGFDFRLATIAVQFGIVFDDESEEWIDRGFFTLDNPSSLGYTIQANAYDNMDKLNRSYIGKTLVDGVFVDITFPISSSDMAQALCDYCGVTFASWNVANDITLNEFEHNESTTCREVLSWVLQVNGGFGRMNPQGELVCRWYSSGQWFDVDSLDGGRFNPWATVDSADGGTMQPWSIVASVDGGFGLDYMFSQVARSTVASEGIQITGIRVYVPDTVEEFEFATVGTNGYILVIENNPFVNADNMQSIANAVYSVIGGMRVRPYNASIYGDPSYEAGDLIGIRDYLGNMYISYITNMRYSVGGIMDVDCGAETITDRENEYSNPQTSTIQSAVTAAYDYIQAKKISADSITAGTLGVNGTITATDLEITGGEVGGLSIIDAALTTTYTHTHTYTSEDRDRISQIIQGNITPTDEDYELYDFNGDNAITALDLATVQKLILLGGDYITTVRIDPHSLSKPFNVTSNLNGEERTGSSIGAGGAYFKNACIDSLRTMDGTDNCTQIGKSSVNSVLGGYASFFKVGTLSPTITMYGANGVVTAASFVNSSRFDLKKNFAEVDSVLDKIKSADILKFNFKDEAENVKAHIGLAVGGEYSVPEEVISTDENGEEQGIDLYSMVSMSWKAIQEQQTIIEELEKRIEVLEKKLNPIGTIKDIIKGDNDGNTDS